MNEPPTRTEARGPLAAVNAVLRRPEASLRRLGEPGGGAFAFRALVAALGGCFLYGLVSGIFQGGPQLLVSALKAPVVVGGSLLLCLPSLYVFSALADGDISWRRVGAATVGFATLLAVILAGLVPIVWLFSVSSRSLTFVVLLHFFLWALALLLAFRILSLAFPTGLARSVVFLWLGVFFVVSLQVATVLRPVLWTAEGGPVIEEGKMFFLQHFGEVIDLDREIQAAEKAGG